MCLNTAFNQEFRESQIDKVVELLMEKYRNEEFFFELTAIDNGSQFLTKNKFSGTLSVLFQQNNNKKLSNAAMETLSTNSYHQPITKSGENPITRANSDSSLQK